MEAKVKKRGVLRRLFFNREDARAYGRFAFFFEGIMENVAMLLSSGVFYTAFLRLNDISMADVAIMSYVPILANLSCVFAPFIFRNMKKRKSVLLSARLLYYLFNIVSVAVIPVLITDASARVALMSVFLSVANVIWGLVAGGFTDWQLNYLPMDGTREEFFAYRGLFLSLFSAGTQILAGGLAAAVETLPEPSQISALFWLRIAGFGFILLDIFVMMRAKEFPYPKSEVRLKLRDVVALPMKLPEFRVVMLLYALNALAANLSASSWSYYLQECGMAYSTLSLLGSMAPITTLLLTPLAIKIFRRIGCVQSHFYYQLILLLIQFGFVFVAPSTVLWLYPALYLLSLLVNVGGNVASANFVYLFMPEEDRLTYYTFYYGLVTVTGFIGAFIGARVVIATEGKTLSMFGLPLASAQLLMLLHAGVWALLVGILAFKRRALDAKEREMAA